MGYRSDVAYIFYVADAGNYPALKLWFDENYPHKEAVDEWGAEVKYEEKDGVFVTYNSVKWYGDYEHVQAVKAAVRNFDVAFNTEDQDYVACWECVEVGQELNDIIKDGSTYNNYRLDVRREIYID